MRCVNVPTDTARASALISSCVDYANSVLYGSPSKNIARLQRTQNAAARVVTQKPSHLSSINTLCELRWLPVQWHIKFKLSSLTVKVTHTAFPPYLSHLLIPYCPSCVLRSSSSSNLLQVPYTNLIFGSLSYWTAAPTIWNSFPDSRLTQFIHTFQCFRQHLKTHLYKEAFNNPQQHTPAPPIH